MVLFKSKKPRVVKASRKKAVSKQKDKSPLIAVDSNISKGKESGTGNQKERAKKKFLKNPYYNLIDTLPKEISSKVNWNKNNLDDMFKTLTPPHNTGSVLRWMRKVSENEIDNIYWEIVNIKMSDRSLKRKLWLTLENYDQKPYSDHSQKSEFSSKLDSDRFNITPKKRNTPYKVINF